MSVTLPNHGDLNWDVTLDSAIEGIDTRLTSHVGSTSNPHSTTAQQVGAVAGVVTLTVSSSTPSNPLTNDLWFNSTAQVWERFNGTSFVPQPQTAVGGGTPLALTAGGASNDGSSNTAAREDHVHGLAAMGSTTDIKPIVFGQGLAAGTTGRPADSAHLHSLTQVPAPLGLGLPGATSVRTSSIVYIVPSNMTVTGFQAVLGVGSGTVIQLVKNGSGVGTASPALTTTISATTFTAVTFVRGDSLAISITVAGTSASDVSVSVDAVFTS